MRQEEDDAGLKFASCANRSSIVSSSPCRPRHHCHLCHSSSSSFFHFSFFFFFFSHSHSELFGHGPSYNRAGRAAARRCLPRQPQSHMPSAHRALPPVLASPQDTSLSATSSSSASLSLASSYSYSASYSNGGSEETKEERPSHSSHYNTNLAMSNKHKKSSSAYSSSSSSSYSADAIAVFHGPMPSSQFYPQGAAPPPRPILKQGDECFVRDGNDSWRPGMVSVCMMGDGE